MPQVSVIIPVYNVEPYIRNCMDSLMNQTLEDIEFICIDDCSTDNSLAILREYAQKDSRFKIITSEKNSGAAAARNKGLDVAKGEYLGFVDPDDAVDLNFYEVLYNLASSNSIDIAKGQYLVIKNNGKTTYLKNHEDIKKYGLYVFCYEWQSAIYRASIIFDNKIRFDDEIIKGQDAVFLNKVVLKSKSIKLTDDVCYHYYSLREGSLNQNNMSFEKFKSAMKTREIVLNDINNAEIFSNKQNRELYNIRYSLCINTYFYTLYKTDEYQAKLLWAKSLINSFSASKDIKALKENFRYKILIPYIEQKNPEKLAKKIMEYKSAKELSEAKIFTVKDFIQSIFSVKNQTKRGKTHKVITVLGIKIRLKLNNSQ